MSEHRVEIIEIGEILPHPNPEVTRLELTHVLGWQCCIVKGQFKQGDKAVYLEPDYVVPVSHPSFAFLKKKEGQTQERIRVRKFKGALSQGLLIEVPPELSHLPVGTNVIEMLGIERYEPPIEKSTGGVFVGGPSGIYAPNFDVENIQRYMNAFVAGEEVVVTEKLDGANARYVFAKDPDGNWKQFCGSRRHWMDEDDKNIWWMAFRKYPQIGEWCQSNPETILYGEVFGQSRRKCEISPGKIQILCYGAKQNDIFFAAFAMLYKNDWVDYDVAKASTDASGVPWAPLIYRGPFDISLMNLAEGPSTWPGADHIREGICIVPVHERTHHRLGRVILKVVSNTYLEKT
jgi:RNA ligase (TIGR02306 family)